MPGSTPSLEPPRSTAAENDAAPSSPAPAARGSVALAEHSIPGARLRYWTVAASHAVVDIYPPFVLSLAAALQTRLALSEIQVAALFAVNQIVSGLSQPLFAWISDRLDTRIFGALGVAVGALGMSMIGFAESYWQLLALQILGMAGVGVFHPIVSAIAGRLGRDAFARHGSKRSARGMGLSIFFAAGVGGGGFLGPLIATRINAADWLGFDGMKWLAIMAAPGLLAAVALWFVSARVSHRTTAPPADPNAHQPAARSDARRRWLTVTLLSVSNTLRFMVNMSLFYLYKVWAGEALFGGTSDEVSVLHGEAIAATSIGMGVSALIFGRLIRQGGEKWPMVLAALAIAPVIAVMPDLSRWQVVAAAFVTAFGFYGVVPTSISLAQRLIPHATGLVGSMLLGCGWAVSAIGPFAAAWIVQAWGLEAGFLAVAAALAASGLICLAVPSRLLDQTAGDH